MNSSQTAKEKRVALLRGVNIGGVKVLMAPLKALCDRLGWLDVESYIASGNLTFRAEGNADELAAMLENALANDIGRKPKILVLDKADYCAVLAAHPFAPEKGNQSHIYFCWDVPTFNNALYGELKTAEEAIQIIDGHVHFCAPNGIGRSKLAEKLNKVITGTEMTGRNLNTARKLKFMLVS